MSIARSAIIGGPCKTVFNGGTFFSKDDVSYDIEMKTSDVEASMHGSRIDEVILDAFVKVPITLWGAWENLSIILPTSYTLPVIGSRIMGDADVPLVITGNDPAAANNILTCKACGITKLPDLHLGVDKPPFGPMEFMGVVGTGLNMEDVGSLFTPSSGAYADTTFAYTNFKQQLYTAAWGARAGFTNFQGQKGWDITHELVLAPVMVQERTIDYKIVAYGAMAKCMPVGPTLAQLSASTNLQVQGTNNYAGHRLGSNADDLIITGQNGVVVTLKNASLKSGGFKFGTTVLRNGEFAWVTSVGFSAGVAGARATFA